MRIHKKKGEKYMNKMFEVAKVLVVVTHTGILKISRNKGHPPFGYVRTV